MRNTIIGISKCPKQFWIVSVSALVLALSAASAGAAQARVVLGGAGNYAVLSKTGISTVPSSAITGDIGVSPIDSTAITGFSLILDSTTQFSTSPQVVGKVYAANYSTPTPANLTAAVSDMQTAFTDAAGRSLPDFTELGTGNIGGMTLAPGLYKWGTSVTVPTDVTLSGGPNDIWIFQIAGNLTVSGGKSVILAGGAQARNIFWQVSGGVGVALGTTSHFEGIILAQKSITMQTGASINGRLLAQAAVTLQSNTVTSPGTGPRAPQFGPVSLAPDGAVTLSITNTPGLTLTLQYTTNLTSQTVWSLLSSPTPLSSPYAVTVGTVAADARRFYRAYYP
jgi:hypothetical protein